jgi:WD40 repeat protein
VQVAEGGFVSSALSPDGAVLALGDRAEVVTLLDTTRPRVLGQITPPPGDPESFLGAMAFSPDGRDLAIGSQQGTIFVYSVDHAHRPRLHLHLRLPGHRGLVTHLVFDPQGQRLASGALTGVDSLVEVWDLDLIRRELQRRGLAD